MLGAATGYELTAQKVLGTNLDNLGDRRPRGLTASNCARAGSRARLQLYGHGDGWRERVLPAAEAASVVDPGALPGR